MSDNDSRYADSETLLYIKNLEAENAALKERCENETDAAFRVNLGTKLLAAQLRIKELREFFSTIKELTLNHGEVNGIASVTPQDLGAALEKIAPNWWEEGALSTPDDTEALDALVRDAERYRWLRSEAALNCASLWTRLGDTQDQAFDAAIDAARKEMK